MTLVDFDDEMMLKDMVRENLTQRNGDFKDELESVILVKNWLEGSFVRTVDKTLSKRGRSGEGRPQEPSTARKIAIFLSKDGKTSLKALY